MRAVPGRGSSTRAEGRALIRHRSGVAALLALVVLHSGCGKRKLDEFVFHQGPRFTLKLVRYYENLPLHYTGEVFRVQCSSSQTTGSPAHETQEAGWVTLGGGGAIGRGSAEAVAEGERRNYVVLSDTTLVVTGGVALGVTFDACGSFEWWDPTKLPKEMIEPRPKPSYCAPVGTADCRFNDFEGEGVPSYTEMRSPGAGRLEFSVTSRAFRGVERVLVTSEDALRSWRFERK